MCKNSKKRKNVDNPTVNRTYLTEMEKYKWTTAGTHEENNIFPFSQSQVRELLEEFVETTENFYLNKKDHERGVVDILIGAARILRRIVQINPSGSYALRHNPKFNQDIEFFEKIRSPYLDEHHDMYYTVDLPPNTKQLSYSISKYLEGLVYSKVPDVSFIAIKNRPQYIEKIPYEGIEMIYNIIDSPISYNQEKQSDIEMENNTSTPVDTLDWQVRRTLFAIIMEKFCTFPKKDSGSTFSCKCHIF